LVEPGDVTAEWQRDVKDAGEISLEEMHHPEDGKKGTKADAGARTQQRSKDNEFKEEHLRRGAARFRFRPLPRLSLAPTDIDAEAPPFCSALAPISRANRVKKQETPAMYRIPAHLPALKWNSSRG